MGLLIVEDDILFLEILRTTLDLRDAVFAHSLREAFAAIDRAKPETILLDLALPDSSTQETIARIRELKTRAGNATVIVITGRPDIDLVAAEAIAQGASRILSKDHGFFDSLSKALVECGGRQTCSPLIDKIEAEVKKIVGTDP